MKLFFLPLIGLFLMLGVNFFENKFIYWSIIANWKNALLFLSGFLIGVRFPDWDFYIPCLKHRSILTHSALLPLLFFLSSTTTIASGLALGIALHLASDIQPKSWTGGALIKCPFIGSIGKTLSPIWIFFNIVACLNIAYKGINLINNTSKINLLMLLSISIYWYFSIEEKNRLVPLSILIIGTLLIHNITTGIITMNTITQFFI